MAAFDIRRYFDLQTPLERRVVRSGNATAGLSGTVPQYVALTLGVLLQPFFQAYQDNTVWSFQWQWIAFALIVTIVIFPAIYRRSWDPDKPMVVQLCTIFSAGLGWQSLLSIGAEAATKY